MSNNARKMLITVAVMFIMIILPWSAWDQSVFLSSDIKSEDAIIHSTPLDTRSWDLSVATEFDLNITVQDFLRAPMDSNPGDDLIFAGKNKVLIYSYSPPLSYLYHATLDLDPTYNISAIVAGDMNSDSWVDLGIFRTIYSEEDEDNTVYLDVYINEGDGNFSGYENVHHISGVWGSGLIDAQAVDVDGITGGDIVLTVSMDDIYHVTEHSHNPETVNVYVLYNTGDGGNFTRSLISSYEAGFMSGYLYGKVRAGHANEDTRPDLAVGIYGFDAINPPNMPKYVGKLEVFLNNGGSITTQSSWNHTFSGHFLHDIEWGDVDGDAHGYDDILVGTDNVNQSDSKWDDAMLWLFSSQGNGQFSAPQYVYYYDGISGIRNIMLGNFDTNEGLDAALTFRWQRDGDEGFTIHLLSGNNYGSFSLIWDDNTDGDLPSPIIFADAFDIDGDASGLYDIVYCGGNHVTVLKDTYIDEEAPSPVQNVRAYDNPDDNGGSIILEWNSYSVSDFDHYNIYLALSPLVDVSGMTPEFTINDMSKTQYEITTYLGQPLSNNESYHIGITAVDTSGHENTLVQDAGPVKPEDNLPPAMITGLSAYDTPDDEGGSITVEWDKSNDPGFGHYNVYVNSYQPFAFLSGANPEVKISNQDTTSVEITTVNMNVLNNGQDYYVAVTAVDMGGNEDIDNFAQLTNPVQPKDNVAPALVDLVKFTDVGSDTGGELYLEWGPLMNLDDFSHYNIYLSKKSFSSAAQSGVHLYAEIHDSAVYYKKISTFMNEPLEDGTKYYAAVTATDTSGNELKTGLSPIFATPWDNVAPALVDNLEVDDKRNDDNGYVVLTWKPSIANDFSYYNIYVSQFDYTELSVLDPEVTVYGRENVSVEINSVSGLQFENGKEYYFYVTAVDTAGNERTSGIYPSTGVPLDDVPPDPIENVYAEDVEGDTGGKIRVSWDKSGDPDFEAYRIYVSTNNIRELDEEGVNLVKKIENKDDTSAVIGIYKMGKSLENGKKYYIAVTAVDINDYENLEDFGEFGPVTPVNNKAPVITDTTPKANSISADLGENVEFVVFVEPNSVVEPRYEWYVNGDLQTEHSGTYLFIASEDHAGEQVNISVLVKTEQGQQTSQTWAVHVEGKETKTPGGKETDFTMYVIAAVIVIIIILLLLIFGRRGLFGAGFASILGGKEEEEKLPPTEKRERKHKKRPGGTESSPKLLGKGADRPLLSVPKKSPSLPMPKGPSVLPPTTSSHKDWDSSMKKKDTLPPPGPGGRFTSVKNYLPPSSRKSPVDVAMEPPRKDVKKFQCPVCGKKVPEGAKRCPYCGDKF